MALPFSIYSIPFFIGMWIFISFLSSKLGWSKLASKYKTDPDQFVGHNIGTISAKINLINYQNCLILKYNNQGIFLKPYLIFKLFHPSLLIPWSEIKSVEQRNTLLSSNTKLIIGFPKVGSIIVSNSTFERFESEYLLHTLQK